MRGWHDNVHVRRSKSGKALDQTGCFQCLVRASLFHRLEAFCGNVDGDFLAELRDEKRLLLKIHLAAARAGRIELRRARAIRIAASHAALLPCDYTLSSHSCVIVHG